MTFAIVLLTVACLAYANGANDVFKGVATLFGSGTINYCKALAWATICTFAGSLTSWSFAETLLRNFSGRGLVDASLTADSRYLVAVAAGAGLTVLLATRVGMPVSTTHALVGGLVGAGWSAGSAINWPALGGQFLVPLLLSPVVAGLITVILYPVLHAARVRLKVTEQSCFCVGSRTLELVPLMEPAAAVKRVRQLSAAVGSEETCRMAYDGRFLGVNAGRCLDLLHFLSAAAVSFARGLNDTPKIAALLLVDSQLNRFGGTGLVALVMAAGGALNARRVAETMSWKITSMNHGQGLAANLVISLIVLSASRFGLPVSTTHVSCGALFGLGAATGGARWPTLGKVFLAWVTTLPCAAALGALVSWLARGS
jgi:PiT family inorganic phosphate transporter